MEIDLTLRLDPSTRIATKAFPATSDTHAFDVVRVRDKFGATRISIHVQPESAQDVLRLAMELREAALKHGAREEVTA
jgi:hypothetical protein